MASPSITIEKLKLLIGYMKEVTVAVKDMSLQTDAGVVLEDSSSLAQGVTLIEPRGATPTRLPLPCARRCPQRHGFSHRPRLPHSCFVRLVVQDLLAVAHITW